MPSASRHSARIVALASAAVLLTGIAAGCSTTQEKAAQHRAEAERILEAREKRQSKKNADRTKTHDGRRKSAHQPERGSSE